MQPDGNLATYAALRESSLYENRSSCIEGGSRRRRTSGGGGAASAAAAAAPPPNAAGLWARIGLESYLVSVQSPGPQPPLNDPFPCSRASSRVFLWDGHACNAAHPSLPTRTTPPPPPNSQAGHEGCVNHCSYNGAGTRLVSGSDDTRLCVWEADGEAPARRPRGAAATGHTQNIFCCKWLASSGGFIGRAGRCVANVQRLLIQ
jgi:hypothetical protein